MDENRFDRMRLDLGQGYMPSRVSMLVNLWRKAVRKGYTLEDMEAFVEYGRAQMDGVPNPEGVGPKPPRCRDCDGRMNLPCAKSWPKDAPDTYLTCTRCKRSVYLPMTAAEFIRRHKSGEISDLN
jgi:hypothetical protein